MNCHACLCDSQRLPSFDAPALSSGALVLGLLQLLQNLYNWDKLCGELFDNLLLLPKLSPKLVFNSIDLLFFRNFRIDCSRTRNSRWRPSPRASGCT